MLVELDDEEEEDEVDEDDEVRPELDEELELELEEELELDELELLELLGSPGPAHAVKPSASNTTAP